MGGQGGFAPLTPHDDSTLYRTGGFAPDPKNNLALRTRHKSPPPQNDLLNPPLSKTTRHALLRLTSRSQGWNKLWGKGGLPRF